MIDKIKTLAIDILIFAAYFIFSILFIGYLWAYKNLNYNLANLIVYIVIICLFFLLYKKEILFYLKDFKTNYKKYLPKYLYMGILGILLMNAISTCLGILLGELSTNESAVRSTFSGTNIIILLLNIGIITPICEELVYRQTFKNLFKNKYIFSICTGLFFAIMHMTSPANALELLYIIPYFVMGYVLSYVFEDSNNLINSIIVHMFNNIITVLLLLWVGL